MFDSSEGSELHISALKHDDWDVPADEG